MSYDYSYGMDSADAGLGAVLAVMGAFILIVCLIALAIAVLQIIGQWKAFKKAGKGGWEALIPFYNQVVCCQITGVNPWWVLIVAVGGVVLNIVPLIGSLLSMALSIYFLVILNVSTARSFGKSDGYAAGLIFLAPIFWLIIGGKNTKYVGPKPMEDKIMNFVTSKMNNNGSSSTTSAHTTEAAPLVDTKATADKFCTECGAKVGKDQKFCPACGKEVK